jgi:hypothetical protein
LEKERPAIQLYFGKNNGEARALVNIEIALLVALVVNLAGVVLATHNSFKEKIGRMKCDSNMKSIMEALEIYHAYYNLGEEVIAEEKVGDVNLDFLVSKSFLLQNLQCPQMGIYRWDSNGELYCTYHGSGEKR